MANYVAYHVHDDDSLLDSCTKYSDYINKAVELGQTAIAITNHGNVYNWLERKLYAEERGVKMLTGMECYVTEDNCLDDGSKRHRDNYHTILMAKNPDGEKELFRLFDTSSKPSHQYYNKRISMQELFNISDNIFKISACLASPLNKLRKCKEKQDLIEQLLRTYDYYEIQAHDNADQIEYNRWLYEMSKRYDKPLIAGTDTHSLNSYKAECRQILKIAKGIEYANEDDFDLTYKSYDELCEMFEKQDALPKEVWLQAIENTNIMASQVVPSEVDRSLKYPILYGDDDEKILRQRINKMYQEKVNAGIIQNTEEYRQRIREEMDTFKDVNYIGFMLFMSEMAEWCWDNGIPLGFCRGSVGGSAVAYITDIIDVNPMKWDTVFSRFCNRTRAGTEVGDIDIDISPSQRHLVQEYIINRFGVDNTGYVLSIGTIGAKGTIDEIGRALDTIWKKSHKGDSPYALPVITKIKEEYEANPDKTRETYKELFYYFDGLINTNISQSMHPAGVIAAPLSLTDNYGTFWNEGKHILAINMEECHTLQLAKYDCLGLKNIEIIKDCCEYAGIKYPKSHEINWEDKDVWKHIVDSPVGIFQFEGDYAFDLLKRYVPTKIRHLSTINASLRPSGASYRDKLISHERCVNPSPMIDELLKDNEGYLIFQEDVIAFLMNICGLDGAEADNVRRAIGRKQMDRLQAALPKILEGYCKMSSQPREIAEKEAQQFLKVIEDSSNYMFGYNHSTGYSMIGYLCAYLRYYYPTEFVAAYLNNANNDDDIRNGTELATQLGIKIKPIQFRHSSAKYMPDKANKTVYKGVASIKYLNTSISEKLYAMRDQTFNSFIDLLDVNPCDARQTAILIKLNYFSEFGKTQYLLDIYDLYCRYHNKKIINKDQCQFDREFMLQFATETEKQYRLTDGNGFLWALCSQVPQCDIPLKDCLDAQMEYLGYIDYVNPKAKKMAYVLNVDTKYAPKLTLYSLSKGGIFTAKVKTAVYNKTKLLKDDIIRINKCEPENKLKYSNGDYIPIPNEYEWWLKNYTKVKEIC